MEGKTVRRQIKFVNNDIYCISVKPQCNYIKSLFLKCTSEATGDFGGNIFVPNDSGNAVEVEQSVYLQH